MTLRKDWLKWLASPFLCICLFAFPLQGIPQDTVPDTLVLEELPDYAPLLTVINTDTVIQTETVRPAYLVLIDSSLISPPDTVARAVLLKPFFRPHALAPKSFRKDSLPWNGNEVSFAILLMAFVLLAGTQFSYGKRLMQVFRACINERYLAQLVRNGDLYNERISLYLFLVFLLCIPLLIMEINHQFFNFHFPAGPMGMAVTYLLILGAFSVLYGIKVLALRIAGVIFKTYAATQEYILTLFVFNLAEGVILSFVLVFVIFADSVLLLRIGLVCLGLMSAYRLFRSFLLGLKESKYSVLYLFLFFTTVEVLPVIILTKLITKFFPT